MFIELNCSFQKKVYKIRVYKTLHSHINISKYSIYQLNLTQNFRVQVPTESNLMKKFMFGGLPKKKMYIFNIFLSQDSSLLLVFSPGREMIWRVFFSTIQENHFLAININGFSNKLHT